MGGPPGEPGRCGRRPDPPPDGGPDGDDAAGAVSDPRERSRVADAGWTRFTPVNAAAIGAYLVGGTVLTVANRGRVAGQRGVASVASAKAGLTALALGATAYSRALGRRIDDAGDVPVTSVAVPSDRTPPPVAGAQRQLRVLQWVIPALTGGIIVLDAILGEQQRPTRVASGVLRRVAPH